MDANKNKADTRLVTKKTLYKKPTTFIIKVFIIILL